MASAQAHKIELNAEVRSVMGGKVASLRKAGLVPAVLYGKDQEPISLQVIQKDFNKTFHAAGESTLVYVTVDLPAQAGGKQVFPTIINDVARDPLSDAIIHADFYEVNLSEKIKAHVPVVFVGESQAVTDGGILIRNVNEIEVEALPQDLPHEISIDISSLAVFGDQVLLKDINPAAAGGATVQIHGNPDEIIATVQAPKTEEELERELATATETPEDVGIVEKPKDADAVLDETENKPEARSTNQESGTPENKIAPKK